jgi:hypothetical protein
VRAKYRIVALGNLDPNSWSKSDCFAPVLSQLELRFLVALAAQQKCIPRTGDITQAFCQSYLPEGEHYVCRPPIGCPITANNTYLRLKKTLYGLRRSPRHFYQLAKKTLLSIGLKIHPSSPCIFYGKLLPDEPPIYIGLYVDDIIYFSQSDKVLTKFETDFGEKLDTTFSGDIDYFLGIKFDCKKNKDGDVSIMMSQEAFIESLCESVNLNGPTTNPSTPYRSGYPVDSIPTTIHHNPNTQQQLQHKMQTLIGSLNWLSISTRPDIATITNLLAKYTSKPTSKHIQSVKRVIKYLKGTKSKGIMFSSTPNTQLSAFVKFPIDTQITSMCDANWGPQDQSKPQPNEKRQLELFKTRSISGFLLWFGGPMHWVSKRQAITARSTAEAEIYATDECTKALQHVSFLIDGLNLRNTYMKAPTTIYNDNKACVDWSHNLTTKGLRHIQIRENAIRENVENKFIQVKHVEGKRNLSDLFTKEDKDAAHFIHIRDFIICDKDDFRESLVSSRGGC